MKSWSCRLFIVVLSLFLLGLGGCGKEVPPKPASTEQQQREADFQNSADIIVCSLEKINLNDVELPENRPDFVRGLELNNEDTLLHGKLRLEGIDFVVLLPVTKLTRDQMALYSKIDKRNPYWWRADEVDSVRKINGTYYEFATLDNRTKFAARPYTGQTGILKIGKGGRSLEKVEFQGSVQSETRSAAIGDVDDNGWPKPTNEYAIPVGDYLPAIMTIKYDDLSITISNNYHRDTAGREMFDRQRIYGFKICPESPYILDFSNDPVVVFDSPAPNENRFEVGREITIAAVLVDPELDIMIRELRDTAVEEEKEYTDAAGNTITYKESKSLEPTVTITRADGTIVGEGVMPFG